MPVPVPVYRQDSWGSTKTQQPTVPMRTFLSLLFIVVTDGAAVPADLHNLIWSVESQCVVMA